MRTAMTAPPAVLLAVALGLLVAAAPATRPAPAGGAGATASPRAVHRVTGLFAPSRADDLRVALESLPGVELVSVDFEHAEATFSYDPAKAFSDAKPEEIVERFNERLRRASGQTLGVKERSTVPRDQLTRVEIEIVPLDCKACCLAIHEILAKQDGVEQAMASVGEGRATALVDPRKTSVDKLRAALKARHVALR